jgi:GMP reductase
MGSRKEVDLQRTYKFRNSRKEYTGIPVMAANMQGVGTFNMAAELIRVPLFTCLDKTYQPADIWDWLNNHVHKPDLCRNVAVSTGITDIDNERIEATLKLCRSIQYVNIDVANGYSERFLDYVARFRDKHPELTIIAGNVVTADITEELLLKGADIVKVGIGPGSVCTTRIKTGVGYPQLSAVMECADAAHGLGGHIIADGGCNSSGDVVKAFGAGADFVMLGGMMAGTDEGGGEMKDGHVEFYGSSTTQAQENTGGVQKHRTSEGRIIRIPHKGAVANVVTDILGGLRSGCTYVGANKLKNLSKCTTFVQCKSTHNPVFEDLQIGE